MNIIEVDLSLADNGGSLAFYRDRLQLPVDGGLVQIGETTLRLHPDRRAEGTAHLAFDIPAGRFRAARDWLAARVPLIADDAGETEFEGPGHWNSRSIYFDGGGGEILELIARRDRPAPAAEGDFSSRELLSISEVGVAVDNPAIVAGELRRLGIEPYGAPVPGFAPCGDVWGLLILVAPERPWFLSRGRLPGTSSLRVRARTGHPGAFALRALAELTTV